MGVSVRVCVCLSVCTPVCVIVGVCRSVCAVEVWFLHSKLVMSFTAALW